MAVFAIADEQERRRTSFLAVRRMLKHAAANWKQHWRHVALVLFAHGLQLKVPRSRYAAAEPERQAQDAAGYSSAGPCWPTVAMAGKGKGVCRAVMETCVAESNSSFCLGAPADLAYLGSESDRRKERQPERRCRRQRDRAMLNKEGQNHRNLMVRVSVLS